MSTPAVPHTLWLSLNNIPVEEDSMFCGMFLAFTTSLICQMRLSSDWPLHRKIFGLVRCMQTLGLLETLSRLVLYAANFCNLVPHHCAVTYQLPGVGLFWERAIGNGVCVVSAELSW